MQVVIEQIKPYYFTRHSISICGKLIRRQLKIIEMIILNPGHLCLFRSVYFQAIYIVCQKNKNIHKQLCYYQVITLKTKTSVFKLIFLKLIGVM